MLFQSNQFINHRFVDMLRRILFLLFLWFSFGVNAQIRQFPDSINRKKLNRVIISESVFYLAGISYLQYIWYHDKERVKFHLFDDSKGWMQIDKGGHALTAYKESYFGYFGLRNSGVNKRKSLIFGGPLGLVLQTPIEVFDGLYEGWGFSWSDMIANTAGSALLVAQEIAWDDQIIKLKMSYQRSKYADYKPYYLGENQLESFFYDYNGHTYWLSANLNKVIPSKRIPNWLNIAVGYSANGMFNEFENSNNFSSFTRHRQWLFSLDVDWTKIPTKNKYLRKILNSMLVLKIPFPALEWNKVDGLKGNWMYY